MGLQLLRQPAVQQAMFQRRLVEQYFDDVIAQFSVAHGLGGR